MIEPAAPPLAPPDLLATIVAAARRVTDVRAETVPLAAVEAAAARRRPDAAGFLAALRDGPSPRVIAECKRRSPSRGILRDAYDPAAHARAYAAAGAAAISVLTEPTFFDGALEHLAAVRSAVRIPILRKDFIVTRYQVYEAVMAGADAVLLIVGALTTAELRGLLAVTRDAGAAALVEAHDETELAAAVDAGAEIVGLNSRNLRTLAVEAELHERLAPRLPRGTVAVAESGLRESADLRRLERAGYQAFLVGERLIVQPDPGAALRALRGSGRVIRVKICGITTPEDAGLAAALGASAIGMVFWPASPRHVDAARAREIVAALPPFVMAVGVFVNQAEAWETAAEAGLDAVQLHGDEPPDWYRGTRLRTIKAIGVSGPASVQDAAAVPARVGVLLDAHDPDRRGGTGTRVDWAIAADIAARRPVILSGGLTAANVIAAIEKVRPAAIDVSSGVESAPGRKDPSKLRALFDVLHSSLP